MQEAMRGGKHEAMGQEAMGGNAGGYEGGMQEAMAGNAGGYGGGMQEAMGGRECRRVWGGMHEAMGQEAMGGMQEANRKCRKQARIAES